MKITCDLSRRMNDHDTREAARDLEHILDDVLIIFEYTDGFALPRVFEAAAGGKWRDALGAAYDYGAIGIDFSALQRRLRLSFGTVFLALTRTRATAEWFGDGADEGALEDSAYWEVQDAPAK